MSEIRYDPIHDIHVIIAEERLNRPYQFMGEHPKTENESAVNCPFCEGHEAETPPERDALSAEDRRPDTPGWLVRSVPNRYPAVSPHEDFTLERDGIHKKTPGAGTQEVIIDTPRHLEFLGEMTAAECENLIHFYHRRLQALRDEHRWRYAQLFKNHGAAAGASIPHPHSQILCLPYLPREVRAEEEGLSRYHEYGGEKCYFTGGCYYCETLKQEKRDSRRFIAGTRRLAAFCPFASRFQGEIWILPKRHIPCFTQSSREELDELARLLRKIIRQLERVLPEPAYNLVLRHSPWRYDDSGVVTDSYFHWRLEILPRVNGIAGFEFGTGSFVNPCSPERFAAEMRVSR